MARPQSATTGGRGDTPVLNLLSPRLGHEALIDAVRADNYDELATLLAAGAPPDPSEMEAETRETSALHEAAKAGNVGMARLLIEAGADIGWLNPFGSAPVHVAAMAGQNLCLDFLFAQGVVVDALDRDGRTPLQEAVQGGHPHTVEMLIAKGADLDIEDDRERSALCKAYDKLQDQPDIADAIAKMLLDAGASPVKSSGEVVLATPLIDAVVVGDIDLARQLVREDPDSIDTLHFRLGSALHIAASEGYVELVDLLLEAGATATLDNDTMALHPDYRTPLHGAARNGHAGVVRALIAAAPDQVRQCHGPPPLVLAAQSGSMETVRLILKAGADPRVRDEHQHSARDAAATSEVRELLRRTLIRTRPKPRRGPPHANAELLAKVLVSEGADSPRVPPRTALASAVGVRSVEVVEKLLAAGADVLDASIPAWWLDPSVAPLPPKARNDPLEYEDAWRQRVGAFTAGLSGGLEDFAWDERDEAAALDWVNSHSRSANAHYVEALTPLHMAAAYDMPKVVERLVELGGRIEATNHYGVTPLELAARHAGAATVERLLWAGADPDPECNAFRDSPLLVACKAANAGAVDALIAAGADVNRKSARD